MHRSFAAWLAGHPWRIPWVTALLGVMSLVLPVALVVGVLPVFGLLHLGPEYGRRAVIVGTLTLGCLTLILGMSPWIAVLNVATLLWLPYALGVLLHRTRSLTVCVQAAVLGAWLLLGVLVIVVDDPVGYLRALLRDFAKAMVEAGFPTAEDEMGKIPDQTIWGVYVALSWLVLLGMVFLARWWQTLLEAPGAFGAEFRQLRLGNLLGAIALAIGAAALGAAIVGRTFALIDGCLWIVVAAFGCVGLAAAHERVASGRLARGWLIAMYVLLILPIRETMLLDIVVLTAWGLADNWRKSRAQGA